MNKSIMLRIRVEPEFKQKLEEAVKIGKAKCMSELIGKLFWNFLKLNQANHGKLTKTEKKMLKNVISEFKAVFSREMFKAWWSELIKLCAKKPVLIIPQLPGNELKNEDDMLNLAYEKLCAISGGVFLHTFFKAENEETMENGAK